MIFLRIPVSTFLIKIEVDKYLTGNPKNHTYTPLTLLSAMTHGYFEFHGRFMTLAISHLQTLKVSLNTSYLRIV